VLSFFVAGVPLAARALMLYYVLAWNDHVAKTSGAGGAAGSLEPRRASRVTARAAPPV
jgi:hypothetical protein